MNEFHFKQFVLAIKDAGFISNLITTMGDVHHIFPKQYLINNGIKDKSKYNQVANFTYLDTPTNIAVSDAEPCTKHI